MADTRSLFPGNRIRVLNRSRGIKINNWDIKDLYNPEKNKIIQMKRKRSNSYTGRAKRTKFSYQDRPRPLLTKASSERKYFDSTMDGDGINIVPGTGWTNGQEMSPTGQGCLFAPTLGPDIMNRIGKKVTVHKISLRGHISVEPNTTGSATLPEFPCVRMVLFVNKQVNGASTNIGDLLSSGTTAGSATIHSFQNVNNFGRFRILKDKTIRLQDPNIIGTTGAGNSEWVGYQVPFKITHKFRKPLNVHFNAGTGLFVANIVQNSLQLAVGASNGNGPLLLHYKCRTTFTDQ